MSDETKKCPFCAEEIEINTTKCKHCDSNLDENKSTNTASIQKETKDEKFVSVITKKCPFCAEEINADDMKCKHCDSNLDKNSVNETKKCPFCAEEIKVDDTKCKHCDSNLDTKLDVKTEESKKNSASQTTPSTMGKRKRTSTVFVCTFVVLLLFFRLFFGIFVIQPIGAIPDGVTIVYWRSGLNLPFVASADGLLEASGEGVSLLGRGIILGGLAKTITQREIFRVGYSETLYLYSTGGKQYEK